MRDTWEDSIYSVLRFGVAAIALMAAGRAEGAVATWDGGSASNSLWLSMTNWAGNVAPAAGDSLVFAGTVRLDTTNDFTADTSFAGLVFDATAGSFSLSGSRITLGGNVTNRSSGTQTLALDMILGATRTFVVSSGVVSVSGVLSGAGGLTKEGDATLVLSGDNSFGGTVTVNDGYLSLRSSTALGSSTKTLTSQGNGAGGLVPAIQFQNNVAVTVATLNVSGAGPGGAGVLQNVSGTNSITATTINLASGGGSSTWGSDSGRLTINGSVSANTTGRGLTLLGAGDGEVAGTLADGSTVALPLTKSGSGRWTLSGNNTFGGTNGVVGGSLRITHANALGAVSNGSGVATGAALELEGGLTFAAEPLTLNGQGVSLGGALRNLGGTNTWTGPITLGSASRIAADAGLLRLDVASGNAVSGSQNLTFGGGGAIAVLDPLNIGSGSITKTNLGTLTLAADSPFTGNFTMTSTGGVTVVKTSGALGVGPKTVTLVGQSGTFSLQLDGSGGDITISSNIAWTISNNSLTTPPLVNLAGNNTVQGPIRLTGGGGFAVVAVSNGTLTLAGPVTNINNAFRALLLSGTGSGTVSGVIMNGALATESTGVQKEGPGVWTLTAMNTYTGSTVINAGTLRLANGPDRLATATTVYLANVSGALLDLNGQSQTIAALGGGGANGGNVALGGATLTVSGAADTTYDGAIGGAGNLIKDGASILTIGGSSAYGGSTTVRGGSLKLNADHVLPDTTDVILAGGTLAVNSKNDEIRSLTFASTSGGLSGAASAGKTLVLNSDGDALVWNAFLSPAAYLRLSSSSGGAIRVVSSGYTGANGPTLSGRLDLGGVDRTFAIDSVPGGSDLFVSSVITNGGVIKTGSGTLKFEGNMQYTGLTDIREGVLFIQSGTDHLPDGNTVQVSGGTLNLDSTETIGTLTLVTGAVEGAGTLTANTAIDVRAGTSSLKLAGPAGLTKTTPGVVTLSASNSYGGSTIIHAGRLALSGAGSIRSSPLILVGASASESSSVLDVSGVTGGFAVGGDAAQVLGGFGSITGAVTVKGGANPGTIAPGNSVGTLAVQGSVTFENGGVLVAELTNPTAFDQLAIYGGTSVLDLGPGYAALDVNLLAYTGTIGDMFRIVQFNNGATLAGGSYFSGLPTTGSTFTESGHMFAITYDSGGVLLTEVPEPATAGLLVLAAAAILRRRRRAD